MYVEKTQAQNKYYLLTPIVRSSSTSTSIGSEDRIVNNPGIRADKLNLGTCMWARAFAAPSSAYNTNRIMAGIVPLGVSRRMLASASCPKLG